MKHLGTLASLFAAAMVLIPSAGAKKNTTTKEESSVAKNVQTEQIGHITVVETDMMIVGEEKIFGDADVDQPASFPGGRKALLAWIADNIQYPATDEGGRVTIRFVVETDGTLTNPQMVVEKAPELNKEAFRLFKAMPKWQPAMVDGRSVRSYAVVPFSFKK